MQEDTLVIPSSVLSRIRRWGLGLLLLAVPACGLSEYEELMRETQEREERFRQEQKYLGEPIQIPSQKDEKGNDIPVADVFFRPPKGINAKKYELRNEMMWRYSAVSGSNFAAVDIAFADNKDDFANKVLSNYESSGPTTKSTQQITAPGQTTPMTFDVWEFSNGPFWHSIYILRDSSKPIALVYIYPPAQRDNARKAIELSLQSLGVDQKAAAARRRYNQKSPWRLQVQSRP